MDLPEHGSTQRYSTRWTTPLPRCRDASRTTTPPTRANAFPHTYPHHPTLPPTVYAVCDASSRNPANGGFLPGFPHCGFSGVGHSPFWRCSGFDTGLNDYLPANWCSFSTTGHAFTTAFVYMFAQVTTTPVERFNALQTRCTTIPVHGHEQWNHGTNLMAVRTITTTVGRSSVHSFPFRNIFMAVLNGLDMAGFWAAMIPTPALRLVDALLKSSG